MNFILKTIRDARVHLHKLQAIWSKKARIQNDPIFMNPYPHKKWMVRASAHFDCASIGLIWDIFYYLM